MRLAVSAILGTAVVLAMLLTALHFFDTKYSKANLRPAVEVEPLPAHSRVDVADWLKEARGDLPVTEEGDPVARLPAPPPIEIAPREVTGFVQLLFTVEADGTASNVRVFGAIPAGYYEEQAIASIRARRWDPDLDTDGRPIARQATEVVEFRLPADAPRRPVPEEG